MPAITFKPRVKETSTTTGTGNITLAGAVVGYQSFDDAFAVTDDYFYYCIEGVDGNGVPTGQWEEGIGHLSASTTLVRDTLLSSSTGSAVSFSAGTKNVFCTVAGEYFGKRPAILCNVLDSDVTFNTDATLGDTGLSLSLDASGKYSVEIWIYEYHDNAGLQMATGGTATFNDFRGFATSFTYEATVGGSAPITHTVAFSTGSTAADVNFTVVRIAVDVNAAGTLLLQGAQGFSHASDTKILRGSRMTAIKLNA